MTSRRTLLAAALGGVATRCSTFSFSKLPYQNDKLGIEKRVEDLLMRMMPEEKLDLLGGAGWMETRGNARLGIPAIHMSDGPLGIRTWAAPGDHAAPAIRTTAFPAAIAMAATWNPELLTQQGRVIAQEALALGRDQVLGPTVNINRTPLWGRNFESYGEDPWLTSRMAVAYISAVQGEGVIATIKHFAVNNQEVHRTAVNVAIDERALQEIYLPAFQAAIEESGVWSVMSAYNKVNGTWCAENPHLLTDILKNKWGFKGFVVSDWGSTHSTVATVNAGLDLEMPGASTVRLGGPEYDGGYLTRAKLQAALNNKQITQQSIDDSVRRILRAMFGSGLFDRKRVTGGNIDTPEQRAVARTAAVQSIVLLKNDRAALPLLKNQVRTIAVIGAHALNPVHGGGSSAVTPDYYWKPLDGIRERAAGDFKVEYAAGGQEAVDLVKRTDVAIVFAGTGADIEGETHDRESLALPDGQNELIQAVAKVNPHTVVVINAGSPVTMDKWMAEVPAILIAWFPGQEAGHAIADVLFGDASPSGKLPVTFPKALEDTPAFSNYPGSDGVAPQVQYAEGIYVGYRYFDKHNIEPLFPFGHGLSYTTFMYSDLRIFPKTPLYGQLIHVILKVKNTGARMGAEVVQIYIHDLKSSVERPPKELKAFKRVELRPGEEQEVTISLDQRALSFYDPLVKEWATEPGQFEVLAGSSSRDIRLKGGFELFQ